MSNHNLLGDRFSRRRFSQTCAAAAAGLTLPSAASQSTSGEERDTSFGVIRGEPTAEKVGLQILAGGGNAVDAAVAAAFVAAIAAPHQTGIGGYGGHMTLALAKEQRVTAIDFNSMAPAAAKEDMFRVDAAGKVPGQTNMYGWLAAGVPGIPAGLELALARYGTMPLSAVLQPAIELAREGFLLGGAAAPLRAAAAQLSRDPGSRQLYFREVEPLKATDRYANPEVAKLLESLASDNSVESFYRGEIAERIAVAFAKNGGLVTAQDLAAYQAREVAPLQMQWGKQWAIFTAPLTAGGATVQEALSILQEGQWIERESDSPDTTQFQVEAFRYAWQDRLQFLGDADHGEVPLTRLLGTEHIRAAAAEVGQSVAEKKPLVVRTTTRPDQGTISLSVADRHGNLVAVTLTHGGSFGSRVTVPGLGLTLGHGMSRFDPRAGHPNAPGAHKRPLNNMCPTIVAKNGRPIIAVGARGGRKIPNAVAEVLLQIVARGKSLAEAVAAPRLHTEGGLGVSFEKAWAAAQADAMKERGYAVTTAASATVSAVSLGSDAGTFEAAMR